MSAPAGSVALDLAGEPAIADPAGVLVLPERSAVLVADLHLEKAAALNRRTGGVLPALDTPATLDRLEALLARWLPARVVALGDSFHDSTAAAQLPEAAAARIAALTAAYDWLWLAGNHDPELPAVLGGTVQPAAELGPLALRHAPGDAAPTGGEVAGHFHPKLRLPTRGGPVTTPCFVEDGRRCILPAFGAYTGGLDCRNPAIAHRLAAAQRRHALGKRKLHTVPAGPAPARAE